MNYMDMFKMQSDAAIIQVGGVAILGLSVLSLGALVWLYVWLGKHLIRYIRKASVEFKECLSDLEAKKLLDVGKKVKA